MLKHLHSGPPVPYLICIGPRGKCPQSNPLWTLSHGEPIALCRVWLHSFTVLSFPYQWLKRVWRSIRKVMLRRPTVMWTCCFPSMDKAHLDFKWTFPSQSEISFHPLRVYHQNKFGAMTHAIESTLLFVNKNICSKDPDPSPVLPPSRKLPSDLWHVKGWEPLICVMPLDIVLNTPRISLTQRPGITLYG